MPAPHFYTMWRFLIRNDLDLSKQSSKSRSMSEASQEVSHWGWENEVNGWYARRQRTSSWKTRPRSEELDEFSEINNLIFRMVFVS